MQAEFKAENNLVEGKTHFVGDDCEGGHREPVAPEDFKPFPNRTQEYNIGYRDALKVGQQSAQSVPVSEREQALKDEFDKMKNQRDAYKFRMAIIESYGPGTSALTDRIMALESKLSAYEKALEEALKLASDAIEEMRTETVQDIEYKKKLISALSTLRQESKKKDV